MLKILNWKNKIQILKNLQNYSIWKDVIAENLDVKKSIVNVFRLEYFAESSASVKAAKIVKKKKCHSD